MGQVLFVLFWVASDIAYRKQCYRVSLGDGSVLRAQRVHLPTPTQESNHGATPSIVVTGQAFENRPYLRSVQCGSQLRAFGLRTQLRRRYAQHVGYFRSMEHGVLPWGIILCRRHADRNIRCHLGNVRVERFATLRLPGVDLAGQCHHAAT